MTSQLDKMGKRIMPGATTLRCHIDPEDEGTLIARNVDSYHRRNLAGRGGEKCSSIIFILKKFFFCY
jgi:hypothetical protein